MTTRNLYLIIGPPPLYIGRLLPLYLGRRLEPQPLYLGRRHEGAGRADSGPTITHYRPSPPLPSTFAEPPMEDLGLEEPPPLPSTFENPPTTDIIEDLGLEEPPPLPSTFAE